MAGFERKHEGDGGYLIQCRSGEVLGWIESSYGVSELYAALAAKRTKLHWSEDEKILVLEEGLNGDSPSFARIFMVGEPVREVRWPAANRKLPAKGDRINDEEWGVY